MAYALQQTEQDLDLKKIYKDISEKGGILAMKELLDQTSEEKKKDIANYLFNQYVNAIQFCYTGNNSDTKRGELIRSSTSIEALNEIAKAVEFLDDIVSPDRTNIRMESNLIADYARFKDLKEQEQSALPASFRPKLTGYDYTKNGKTYRMIDIR